MEKQDLPRRLYAFLKGIFSLASLSAVVFFGTFFWAAMLSITEDSANLSKLFDIPESISSPSEQELNDLKAFVIYGEAGHMGVSWVLLTSLVEKQHGFAASENVARKAMNRLQGWELFLYLNTMSDRIPGAQNFFAAKSEMPDVLPKAYSEVPPTTLEYQLSDAEKHAVASCQQAFNLSPWYDYGSFAGNLVIINIMIETTLPKLIDAPCSLSGKIDIKTP